MQVRLDIWCVGRVVERVVAPVERVVERVWQVVARVRRVDERVWGVVARVG